MHITLHCGGMPFNGETARTESLGGSESAAYYLARELATRGHRVTLFTRHQEEGTWDDVRYIYAGEERPETPFGERFHFYMENTPCDVLVMQRHVEAFRYRWASKVQLWWLHDLALARNWPTVRHQVWNIDGILTVSDWHRDQVRNVYGITDRNLFTMPNGVDPDLAKAPSLPEHLADPEALNLYYGSRPERGLEHLVREGGIMDRLRKERPEAHLYVSMYNNVTPETKGYYEHLWRRCEELPNVTNLGVLTRAELAAFLRDEVDLLVYPTEFEETSCMLVKEAMVVGVPVLASRAGALPETLEGAGATLLPLDRAGRADEDAFVRLLGLWDPAGEDHRRLSKLQERSTPGHAWSKAADGFEAAVSEILGAYHAPAAVARELMYTSDIYALDHYLYHRLGEETVAANPLLANTRRELEELYWFRHGRFAEHYAGYYQHERGEKGVAYQGFELAGTGRLEHLSKFVATLPEGALVLDYGCAHGSVTIPLAYRFPDKRFLGIDLDEPNLAEARGIAERWGLENVDFRQGDVEAGSAPINLAGTARGAADLIIVTEVLEHVQSPGLVVDRLAGLLRGDGRFFLTTPSGPWEATGYRQEHPWRAHVHHLERADLHDLFGHHPGFTVQALPDTHWRDRPLGHYVTVFGRPEEACGSVDYDRKIQNLRPRQTLSVCMIVGGAAGTVRRALASIETIADEVVVGLDRKTLSAEALGDLEEFQARGERLIWPLVRMFDVSPPLEAGFDAARNETLERAHGDWILWLDADEWLSHPEEVVKYLRYNPWDGYVVRQHHMSAEPAGVLKTDLPVKLFRNGRDIRFFGRVHEHPEKGVNQGVGPVGMLPDAQVIHDGYEDEATRRSRFRRNLELLARDREDYPDRLLGKFLWLRDLAQMNHYELESNGGRMTPTIVDRIEQGLELWENLVEEGDERMVREGLQFYSSLARLRGGGFWGLVQFNTDDREGIQPDPVEAYFANADHARRVMTKLVDEGVRRYEQAYY